MSEKSPLIYPLFHRESRRQSRSLWVMAAIVLIAAVGIVLWRLWPEKSQILKITRELRQTVSLAPALLGYDRPKTYLVLFLNNAELRPGGGFIGSYALVKIDRGRLTSFETSGSENLDWASPEDFKVEPPSPIRDYLGQPNWYFRDSNWSPDFPESARAALWFYRFEGGQDGSKIDGVVGMTPLVVEKLLGLTGPVEVDGKIFNAENITEELQYQVEFGYKKEGKKRVERKVLIGDLGRALLQKMSSFSPLVWKDIYSLSQEMFKEKQLMIWSTDQSWQSILAKQGWAGEVKKVSGDYLMVVDSNMISLKSDPEVERRINYQIRPENGRLRARVAISYAHHGEPSWKVSRYRSYTRIYAPAGSQLISSDGFIQTDKIKKGEEVQIAPAVASEELGQTVFGGFFFVGTKKEKILTIEYYLPEQIIEQVKKGGYALFVQKQLGSAGPQLTIDLNFGKKIGTTGGSVFHQETDLKEDRGFVVELGR